MLTACCFATDEDVCLTIPHVPQAAYCTVTWTDSANCENTNRLSQCQTGAEQRITLTVSKNGCTPVVVTFYDDCNRMCGKPYGMIIPYTNSLNQKDGFSAELLRALYVSAQNGTPAQVQNYLSRFDWVRFMQTCRTYEDPWLLDKERLMKAIAGGSFKKSDFHLTAE
ncbi:MAG: hypothetical protein IIT68_08735 [Treponema sp.]|nr:hypothetical protein [Treponema sp.]